MSDSGNYTCRVPGKSTVAFSRLLLHSSVFLDFIVDTRLHQTLTDISGTHTKLSQTLILQDMCPPPSAWRSLTVGFIITIRTIRTIMTIIMIKIIVNHHDHHHWRPSWLPLAIQAIKKFKQIKQFKENKQFKNSLTLCSFVDLNDVTLALKEANTVQAGKLSKLVQWVAGPRFSTSRIVVLYLHAIWVQRY